MHDPHARQAPARTARVWRKLAWRSRFVRDPARHLADAGTFDGIADAALRDALLADARALPLAERLRLVAPFGGGRPGLEHLLRRRLRTAPDGAPYFDLGGTRLFFRPDHAVHDEAEVLRGALVILREAYVDAPEFFRGPVRIAPGDVVLDLGGNLGTSAMRFASLAAPAGRVWSFEPIYHRLLRRNVEENGVQGVEVVAAGAGETSGEAVFAVTDVGIDSRLARPTHGGLKVRVPMVAIDDWVEREKLARVDFVKMDIEGAEELALRGAARTIARFRPKLTIASYHTDPEGDAQHPKLLRLLREWGYRIEERPGRHLGAWSA